MQSQDPTLRKAEGFKFGQTRRFAVRAPTDGTKAALGSLLDDDNGRICGVRGSFPRPTNRPPGNTGRGVAVSKKVCAVAYYGYPGLLEDGASGRSKGVVRSANRIVPETTDSPGPIFFPERTDRIPGGGWSHAARFAKDAPPTEEDDSGNGSEALGYSASFGGGSLRQSRSLSGLSGRASTADVSGERARPVSSCTFGTRTRVAHAGSTNGVHSYDNAAARPPRPVVAAPLPVQPVRAARPADATPGPGHFFKNQFHVTAPTWSFGRRTRRAESGTPGPGAYDVAKADAKMRRKRH